MFVSSFAKLLAQINKISYTEQVSNGNNNYYYYFY